MFAPPRQERLLLKNCGVIGPCVEVTRRVLRAILSALAVARPCAPDEPSQNAFVGSFNGRLHDECLNQRLFSGSAMRAPSSKRDGSTTKPRRSHTSLGGLASLAYAQHDCAGWNSALEHSEGAVNRPWPSHTLQQIDWWPARIRGLGQSPDVVLPHPDNRAAHVVCQRGVPMNFPFSRTRLGVGQLSCPPCGSPRLFRAVGGGVHCRPPILCRPFWGWRSLTGEHVKIGPDRAGPRYAAWWRAWAQSAHQNERGRSRVRLVSRRYAIDRCVCFARALCSAAVAHRQMARASSICRSDGRVERVTQEFASVLVWMVSNFCPLGEGTHKLVADRKSIRSGSCDYLISLRRRRAPWLSRGRRWVDHVAGRFQRRATRTQRTCSMCAWRWCDRAVRTLSVPTAWYDRRRDGGDARALAIVFGWVEWSAVNGRYKELGPLSWDGAHARIQWHHGSCARHNERRMVRMWRASCSSDNAYLTLRRDVLE